MYSAQAVRDGYFAAGSPGRDARSTEYQAFARVTRSLHLIDESDPTNFAALASALHENQRLWNIIASDVAFDSNPLPESLRARLFYLGEFTRIHAARVIAGNGSAAVLIDINTAIMRGLRPIDADAA